ncbi:MAG: hypothetical protein ACYS47_10935 [Planctomycetota bacterium]
MNLEHCTTGSPRRETRPSQAALVAVLDDVARRQGLYSVPLDLRKSTGTGNEPKLVAKYWRGWGGPGKEKKYSNVLNVLLLRGDRPAEFEIRIFRRPYSSVWRADRNFTAEVFKAIREGLRERFGKEALSDALDDESDERDLLKGSEHEESGR